jgi:hypothetical protein
VELLSSLVRAEPAAVVTEPVREPRGVMIMTERVRITEAGLQAIHEIDERGYKAATDRGRLWGDAKPPSPQSEWLGGRPYDARHCVRGLFETCRHCGHERAVDMDCRDSATVPSFGPRMRCSRCGRPGATAVPKANGQTDLPGGAWR